MKHIITIIILSLILFSCTGDEILDTDTTPPNKPVLVPHLGDVGYDENDNPITAEFEGEVYELTEENNGIDAVPYNNFLKINWLPIIDSDIDFLRIYRFNSYEEEPKLIDSLVYNYNQQTTYWTDESLTDYTGLGGILDNRWYYKIEAIDKAGNSTISDSVSYKLINKALPISPAEGDVVSDELVFVWGNNSVNGVMNTVQLFNENNYLLWEGSHPTPAELDSIACDFNCSQGTYYWRVDSEMALNGVGSESNLVKFYIE